MSVEGYSRRAFLTALGLTGASIAAADWLAAGPAYAAIPGPDRYTANWSSVDQHPPAPEWFQDAKFGIYFHWGVFSVPAYGNEWYPRRMYISGDDCANHHTSVFGGSSTFPYHNFINGGRDLAGNRVQFAPKLKSAGGNFDPAEWAQLFADAGAKFAGPVAEHHDGYSMWDSTVNEWNSAATGPRLDLLALHAEAIRAKGLKLLVAMHHAYHFTGYYDHVPAQTDPSLMKLYGQLGPAAENQLWYDKLKEVVDRVQPDILYQDFNLTAVDESQRLNFLAYYYNQAIDWDKEVVATYKDGFDNSGEVFDYERGGPADINTPYWLTDDSISSSSWCYTTGIGYYTVNQMLHSLIDRVSKGGNMVLNIAPMADGTIPAGQRSILLSIGDYLERFGESIYTTRIWSAYGEGPTRMGGGSFSTPRAGTPKDIRFTRSKDSRILYATLLGWPGSTLTITTLAADRIDVSTLTSVQLLGSAAGTYTDLPTPTQDSGGLRITLPASAPYGAPAYVVRLTFSGTIPPLAAGPVSQVTAYLDVDYAGVSAGLALGGYTAAQLRAAGVPAAGISSIRVPAGLQITGYSGDNFTGTAWVLTADNADLRATGNNDAIVSARITLNPATWFRITNLTSGLALDSGGNVAAGSNLKQMTWDGSPNLQWQAVDLGTGWYRLVNRTNGMVADGNGATADGASAQQAAWNGGVNQQWQITDRGAGNVSIANRGSGLVLDSGGAVASGSVVKQWTWNGSPNLQWTFTAG